MPVNLNRLVLPVTALFAAIFISACGSIATPEWASEAQETQTALAVTSQHLTAIAPTQPPTNTAIPPTATRTSLPTATIVPTDTPPPTEAPTIAATTVPTEVAAAQGVTGDPERGQVVFTTQHQMPDGPSWMCATCHSITPDEQLLIGPGLWNVSVRALTYPGVTDPAVYVHDSIVSPADFTAPHPQGIDWPLPMPTTWAEVLTEQVIADLVAYVMTLHD
jgi:mono/diheme cytochrome c family protein